MIFYWIKYCWDLFWSQYCYDCMIITYSKQYDIDKHYKAFDKFYCQRHEYLS